MTCRRKGSGHQHHRFWPSSPGIYRSNAKHYWYAHRNLVIHCSHLGPFYCKEHLSIYGNSITETTWSARHLTRMIYLNAMVLLYMRAERLPFLWIEPRYLLLNYVYFNAIDLTHWDLLTYICISRLAINGSDNGLSPAWRHAIIRTNAGPLETSLSEILIQIYKFSFKKLHLKMSSREWWPFCLGLLC